MPTFEYVTPTPDQVALMQHFRILYQDLYFKLAASDIPRNRGYHLAITKLEESAMWINKSITENC